MTESSVRVGVRVRPLVAKERGQGVIIDSYNKESINFRGQTFTFDHVFGLELSQTDLYQHTAAPMLKNFLDGYNCTIMAYGQTGSGKTYTMGTSDIKCQNLETQGLIPRFVNDLFENLNQPQEGDQKTVFKIKASFLEIYGEDIFDLLSANSAQTKNDPTNRPSLNVREDEAGRVFVQGQNELEVTSARAALEVLSMGSHNRITAATAMNAGSSRSHAVFTLQLEQTVKNADSNEDISSMTSKLTFVDLAGSERIKRTGAEGQRLKEGIQINSGLFNLGQVINSLADEQKLKSGMKSSFVPYRNSTLTHLLKDALGGNSQTLFLACISPAESNESETYSTLSYARQARNIKNKPVRNMDRHQLEVTKLKCAVKTWMMKAVTLMFSGNNSPSAASDNDALVSNKPFTSPTRSVKNAVLSPTASTFLESMKMNASSLSGAFDEESLLKRPEVIEFINSVNASIQEKIDITTPSPRKIRLSLGYPGGNNGAPRIVSPIGKSNLFSSKKTFFDRENMPVGQSSQQPHEYIDEFDSIPIFPTTGMKAGRESVLMSNEINVALEAATHLDETEQLVERMIDMVHKEKKLLGAQSSVVNHLMAANNNKDEDEMENNASFDESMILGSNSLDDNVNAAATVTTSVNQEEIIEVDRLIQEKEEILTKLLDNVKSYNAIKLEFEKLVDAINSLEKEKYELENELEKAKKSTTNSNQLEKLKERFQTIKDELNKMKNEKKSKESVYKLMQKESKQCEIMQKEIQKLKEAKISLMKQQKSTNQQLLKLKKENQIKEQNMKKSDIKKQQMMNNLKSELSKKERIIGHKEKELNRVIAKLKACEDHITQLLKIQNRNRNKIVNPNGTTSSVNNNNNNSNSNSNANANATTGKGSNSSAITFFNSDKCRTSLDTHDLDYYNTSKNLLEQVLLTQIEKKLNLIQYQKKANELKELNLELLHETQELENLHQLKNQILSENNLLNGNNSPNPNGNGNGNNINTNELLLSEESNYEIENINKRILYMENNIERISKEIDLYNSDLDDLSLRIEEFQTNKDGANNDSSSISLTTEGLLMAGLNFNTNHNNNNNWQLISHEIINSLNYSQSQLFINELLNEKLSFLENIRLLETNNQKMKNDYQMLNERHSELIHYNSEMNANYLEKMKNLEKQRISEIWTILKSNENASSSSSTTSNNDEVAQEIIQSITLQRTKDLEKELENFILAEENYKNLQNEQLKMISSLQYEKEKLMNELSIYQQTGGSTLMKSSSSSLIADNNEEGRVRIPSNYLQEVSYYWNEIGYSRDLQNEMINSILQSQMIIQSKLLNECKNEFTNKQNEINKFSQFFENILIFTNLSFKEFNEKFFLTNSLTTFSSLHSKLSNVLTKEEKEFLKSCNNYTEILAIKPQKKCLLLLNKLIFLFCYHFYEKDYSKLISLKDQVDSLLMEMMLSNEYQQQQASNHSSQFSVKISSLLQTFSKLKLPSQQQPITWQFLKNILDQLTEENDEDVLEEDRKLELQYSFIHEIMKFISSLTSSSLSMKEWNVIENEWKTLNFARIQFTNKIITKRDNVIALLKDLSISYNNNNDDSSELSNLIHSILLQESDLNDEIITIDTNNNKAASSASSAHQDEMKKKENQEKLFKLSIQILTMKSLSNPPGAESLLLVLEKIQLLLESIKCNRMNLSTLMMNHLWKWLQSFQDASLFQSLSDGNFLLFPIIGKQQLSSSSTSVNMLEFLTNAKEKPENDRQFYQKDFIMNLLSFYQGIISNKWKQIYSLEIDKLLSFMKTFNNLLNTTSNTTSNIVVQESLLSHIRVVCKQLVQQYQKKHNNSSTSQSADSVQITSTAVDNVDGVEEHYSKLMSSFQEFFEEISSIMLFLEESWIQEQLLSLVSLWDTSNHSSSYFIVNEVSSSSSSSSSNESQQRYSLKELIYQCSFLWIEIIRFQHIHDTFMEMKKQDNLFIKHITEFEEFENNSIKDRAKVLSGNSKALIEEEKYRKNAKKRYEIISEKLIQIFQKLISLTTMPFSSSSMNMEGNTNNVVTPVPIPITTTTTNNSPVMLDCKIDLNCFSQYTQNILKNGIQKERLELIRLHTSAAMFSLPNNTPVATTTTAANATTAVTTTTTSNNNGGTNSSHPPLVKRVSEKDISTKDSEKSTAAPAPKRELTRERSGNNLYLKNKEKLGASSSKSTTSSATTTASKSMGNNNNSTKSAASSKDHAHGNHKESKESKEPKESSAPVNTSTRLSVGVNPAGASAASRDHPPHHHYHRLSINSRLSISTSEPGLLPVTPMGSNKAAYAFQPPTPPHEENHDTHEQKELSPSSQDTENRPTGSNGGGGKKKTQEGMNGSGKIIHQEESNVNTMLEMDLVEGNL